MPNAKEAIALLTDKSADKRHSVIKVGNIEIGGGSFCVMAGPCTVENAGQVAITAKGVGSCGAHILRGGAFKLRTSPYTFEGLGEQGLKLLKKAGEEQSMPIVSELPSVEYAGLFAELADIIQIGARNMQNVPLLRAAAHTGKPILLKRGSGNTLEELLFSAEFILKEGNEQVFLCERGIRSFEHATRFTLDLGAVPYLKHKTHLPVIVDPSHAMGEHLYVPAMAKAAWAAGADGVIIEVHNEPEAALCDAAQALDLEEFADLMQAFRLLGAVK